MLEQGTINIPYWQYLSIIKKSLYSDHEIFLRELVSNAVDAIQKLKMVSRAGEYTGDDIGDRNSACHGQDKKNSIYYR